MSKRNEKLSAYLDGEIHRDELMSFSLSSEEQDAKTAMRYQLVGDVLRGETSELSTVDISAAVREALADENIADQMPVQAAVKGADSQAVKNQNKRSSGQISSDKASGGLLGWLSLRPIAGMAMAATVAAVTVMSVTQQNSPSSTPVASNDTVNVTPSVQLATEPQPLPVAVIQNLPSQLAATPVAPAQSVPAAYTPKLNPYLNEHFATQGSFSQGALQSRMPYARAVSLEPVK